METKLNVIMCACSQATDCGRCKGCFCANSNDNKVELDEQHI